MVVENNTNICCEGMAMSMQLQVVEVNIQQGFIVLLCPNGDQMVLNYCPWCGTKLNDAMDMDIPRP